MAVTSANWANALDPLIHHWFEQGFSRRPSLIDTLYNVQSSENSDEQVQGIGAIGTDAWDNFENLGQIPSVDFDAGYTTTYTHQEKIYRLPVQRKFIDDNKVPQIARWADRLGDAARQKREIDAASTFNNGFSDTFAGADGVGLLSAAHPVSPSKTGVTVANEGTLALTADNIATTREAMMAFTDDNSELVAVTPDTILVPPELEDEALVATRSVLAPGNANNDINPQNGRFRVVTWHYLTDATAWFMIDSSLMKNSLDWFDRVPLSINMEVMDTTIFSNWIAYMRYSYGWSDWRWIYGQNG